MWLSPVRSQHLILALVCIAIGTGCQKPAAVPAVVTPTSKPTSHYLALGDSYTIGESVAPADRWPTQLAKLLRKKGLDVGEPTIVARTGWTTDELSAGIDRSGVKGPYALVTLLIGVNNQFRGRSEKEFADQFDSLLVRAIDFAGGKPGHVIVVSIPDWGAMPFAEGRDRQRIGKEIDSFNAICRHGAEQHGIAFVDITPESRTVVSDSSLVAPDGLHPSGKMYGEWAQAVLPVAEDALAGKAKPSGSK